MKFVENVTSFGRSGLLSDFPKPWNAEQIKTPLFLTHTRAGTIPHLTFESLKYLKSNNMYLLQTLPTIVEFKEAVLNQGKSLGAFVGLQEFPFHISIQDPAVLTPTGYNVKRGVSVWTHGGKKLITPDQYMNIIKVFRPVSYQALCDSDTTVDCSVKRLNKSVDHSLNFLDSCLEEHKKSPELRETSIFGTIQGGYDLFLRKKSAQQTAIRPVDGFILDGFHINGPDVQDIDFCKVKPILLETISLLPSHKPRILNGSFSLEIMLEAIKCGIDVFDSSYAYTLTEAGEATIFPLDQIKISLDSTVVEQSLKKKKYLSKINLKLDIYKDDFDPVLIDCQCYTCNHYSKAYINHLLLTSELLAYILLMIHNLHHISKFFESVRDVIENKKIITAEIM